MLLALICFSFSIGKFASRYGISSGIRSLVVFHLTMAGCSWRSSALSLLNRIEHSGTALRSLSTTNCLARNKVLSRGKPMYIHRWRREHDIPEAGTDYGPLTDLPDFRFMDGTPGPLGRGQRNRLLKSEMFAERILHLTKEVDSAVATQAEMEKQRIAEREAIIRNKLKEKNERLKSMFSPLRTNSQQLNRASEDRLEQRDSTARSRR